MACRSLTLKLSLLFLCFMYLPGTQVLSLQDGTRLWVVYNEKLRNFKVSDSAPSEFIALASFDNAINKTGWAKLDIVTTAGKHSEYTDLQQAYAAGFVEGHITRSLIKMHWQNTVAGFCPEPLSTECMQLKKFLEQNLAWLHDNINTLATKEPYWYHVQLYLQQMVGLQDGYSDYPGEINMNIDVLGVYFWQISGDLEDLMPLFSGPQEKPHLWEGSPSCSALLRLLPDFSDLYISQVTWNDLSSMLRILKKYSFEFHPLADSETLIAGHTMTFSSYPGMLSSGDDFYSLSSRLVSQETTIGNSNPNLTIYISYKSVLESYRSMVANRLAHSGHEWAQLFSKFNSGTYNNQWMVVDYRLFVPGHSTPMPGLFYLVEQIPGTIEFADMTTLLYNQSYYGSYNIAFFPKIFAESGGPEMVKKFGDWFTYDRSPRALIFKRDVPKVKDLDSMTKLMRYNNFKKDPLSRCNCTPPYSAENAIACRDDLNPANGTYPFDALGHRPHIATDMKLTSLAMSKTLSFLAVSGPTHDDLPPFKWSTSDYRHMSHVGHPDLWVFPRMLFNGTYPIA